MAIESKGKVKKAREAAAGKLAGKSVALVGTLGHRDWHRELYVKQVRAQGGRIAKIESTVPDYLVVGDGRGGKPPAIVAQVQKRHAAVQVLDEAGLCQMLLPSPEEVLAELLAPTWDRERWGQVSSMCSNARLTIELRNADLRKIKIARAADTNSPVAKLDALNLKGADLRNAAVQNVRFGDLKGAKLDGAKLEHGNLQYAENCTFRKADMTNFRSAALAHADFSNCWIKGVDLSTANLDSTTFFNTWYDEHTVLPSGFVPPDGLEWKGAGPRPGTPAPPQAGTLDFDAFLQLLNNKGERARMQKAGSMLKAERFQLFAEVNDGFIAGVVKSQSSNELVYSCRLASDGTFACCTQNLRPCGGLRGALCKHLLVLIIGLARSGQLDAATVDHWIDLSKNHKPAIDEDGMSATFLRYKGAEAGEVDWRPTETIPEDYYAL